MKAGRQTKLVPVRDVTLEPGWPSSPPFGFRPDRPVRAVSRCEILPTVRPSGEREQRRLSAKKTDNIPVSKVQRDQHQYY